MDHPVDIMFDNPRVDKFTRDLFVDLAIDLGLGLSEPDIELTTLVVKQFMNGLYTLLCEWEAGTGRTDNPYALLLLLNEMATFPMREDWKARTRQQFECFQFQLRHRFEQEPWAKRQSPQDPTIREVQPARWWKIMTGTGMILFHRFLVRDLRKRDLHIRRGIRTVARANRAKRMPMATATAETDATSDDEHKRSA